MVRRIPSLPLSGTAAMGKDKSEENRRGIRRLKLATRRSQIAKSDLRAAPAFLSDRRFPLRASSSRPSRGLRVACFRDPSRFRTYRRCPDLAGFRGFQDLPHKSILRSLYTRYVSKPASRDCASRACTRFPVSGTTTTRCIRRRLPGKRRNCVKFTRPYVRTGK